MKIGFSWQFFVKILECEISWKSVHWEPSCCMRTDGQPGGRTGRHEEANNRFSQFCNCISKLCASAMNLAKLWHSIEQATLNITTDKNLKIQFISTCLRTCTWFECGLYFCCLPLWFIRGKREKWNAKRGVCIFGLYFAHFVYIALSYFYVETFRTPRLISVYSDVRVLLSHHYIFLVISYIQQCLFILFFPVAALSRGQKK